MPKPVEHASRDELDAIKAMFAGLLERVGGRYHYTREEHEKVKGRFIRFRKLDDGTFLAYFDGEARP